MKKIDEGAYIIDDNTLKKIKDIIRNRKEGDGGAVFVRLDVSSGSMSPLCIRIVSAMLNTRGGYVIACADDDGGFAANGLRGICEKVEKGLAAGIVPEWVPGEVSVVPVEVDGTGYVAVEVGPGKLLPYAVVEDRTLPSYGFFSRSGCEVVPMDFTDIQSLVRTDSAVERMRNHVAVRCRAICANDAFIPLVGSAKIVVHILPEDAFCGEKILCAPDELEGHEWVQEHVSTLTGDLLYYSDLSYVHVGLHGDVEAVDAMKLRPKRNGKKSFYIADYQKDLSDLLDRCSRCFEGYTGNLYMGISLVGARGYVLLLKIPKKTFTVDSDLFMLPLLPVVFEKNFTKDMLTAQVNRHLEMIWGKSGY